MGVHIKITSYLSMLLLLSLKIPDESTQEAALRRRRGPSWFSILFENENTYYWRNWILSRIAPHVSRKYLDYYDHPFWQTILKRTTPSPRDPPVKLHVMIHIYRLGAQHSCQWPQIFLQQIQKDLVYNIIKRSDPSAHVIRGQSILHG